MTSLFIALVAVASLAVTLEIATSVMISIFSFGRIAPRLQSSKRGRDREASTLPSLHSCNSTNFYQQYPILPQITAEHNVLSHCSHFQHLPLQHLQSLPTNNYQYTVRVPPRTTKVVKTPQPPHCHQTGGLTTLAFTRPLPYLCKLLLIIFLSLSLLFHYLERFLLLSRTITTFFFLPFPLSHGNATTVSPGNR